MIGYIISPNIHPAFGSDAAEMLIFPKGEPIDLTVVKSRFKRFMVKDYVKLEK